MRCRPHIRRRESFLSHRSGGRTEGLPGAGGGGRLSYVGSPIYRLNDIAESNPAERLQRRRVDVVVEHGAYRLVRREGFWIMHAAAADALEREGLPGRHLLPTVQGSRTW